MSDVVTYTKNGTEFVVSNPNNPIASDAWYDLPRKDSNGDAVLDDQNRVVVDRHVTRSSVDISNCATKTELSNALTGYATVTALNAKADVSALNNKANTSDLNNYLSLSGGALTGAVTSNSVAQFNRVQEGVVTANSGVLNCLNGSYFIVAPSDDISLAVTNMVAGQTITIKFVNGGAYTIVYPSNWLWASGSIPELQEEGVDLLVLTYDGANYIASALTELAAVSE